MAKREIPTPISEWRRNAPADPLEAKDWPEGAVRETTFTRRPETPIEALLEATPGETPETSLQEIAELRDVVIDAIEQLPDRLRFVVDAINSERLSLHQLARRMGISKTHAHRLREQAFAELRAALSTHPIIRRRMNMKPETWQHAALDALSQLCPMDPSADDELNERIRTAMSDMRSRFHYEQARTDLDLFYMPAVRLGRAAAGWLDNHACWDLDSMHALLCRKQRDYGHGNINAFGAHGVVVRLSDKVERMHNLTLRNLLPSNETLIDTYDDLVGYAAILIMLANDTFNLEYHYE